MLVNPPPALSGRKVSTAMAQKLTPKERTRFVRIFGDGDPRAAEEFFSKLVTIMRDALAAAPKLVAALTTALQGSGASDGQINVFFAGLGLVEPTAEAFRTLILGLAAESAGAVEGRLNQRIEELPRDRAFIAAVSSAADSAEKSDFHASIRRIREGLANILSKGLAEGQPPLQGEAVSFDLAKVIDRRFTRLRTLSNEDEFLGRLQTAWETFVAEMTKVVEPLLQKKNADDAPAIARWLLADAGVTTRNSPGPAKDAINTHPIFREKLLASNRTKATD